MNTCGVAKRWEYNIPTVNKNGHLPSTAAAVWIFSSKMGIIGYREVVSMIPFPVASRTYIDPPIVARKILMGRQIEN